MDDAAPTAGLTTGGQASSSGDPGAAAPCLRTVGYCAECGTWDEHGAVCACCGYDFAGVDTGR